MAYTIKSKAQVELRLNGVDYSGEYGPGDVDLPEPVAQLLIEQGLATPATSAKKPTKPTPIAENPEE